jgi:hypothetical protein
LSVRLSDRRDPRLFSDRLSGLMRGLCRSLVRRQRLLRHERIRRLRLRLVVLLRMLLLLRV